MLRRLRFSLRGVFTFIMLLAALMALGVSYRVAEENRRVRSEITRLRNEAGELTIEPGNEHKVHAIKVPMLEPYTWRWRVYAPQGRPISLRVATESTYGDGKPAGSGSNMLGLSPGETLITLGLRRSPKGRWEWAMQATDGAGSAEGRGGIVLDAEDAEVLVDNSSSSASGVYQSTSIAELGDDLELLNLKMSGSSRVENIKVTVHDGSP
jgi:hypothetical protein